MPWVAAMQRSSPSIGTLASANLRFAQSKALGRKVSGESTVLPSVAVTIVRSIAAVMKRHGGKMSVSIRRLQPDPFGSKATRNRWVMTLLLDHLMRAGQCRGSRFPPPLAPHRPSDFRQIISHIEHRLIH